MGRRLTDETGNTYNGFLALERVKSNSTTPRYLWRCVSCAAVAEKYLNTVKPTLKAACQACGSNAASVKVLTYLFLSPSRATESQGPTPQQAALHLAELDHFVAATARVLVLTKTRTARRWHETFIDWGEVKALSEYKRKAALVPADNAAPISPVGPPPGLVLTLRTADTNWLALARELADPQSENPVIKDCPMYIREFFRINSARGIQYKTPNITSAGVDRLVAYAIWPR